MHTVLYNSFVVQLLHSAPLVCSYHLVAAVLGHETNKDSLLLVV